MFGQQSAPVVGGEGQLGFVLAKPFQDVHDKQIGAALPLVAGTLAVERSGIDGHIVEFAVGHAAQQPRGHQSGLAHAAPCDELEELAAAVVPCFVEEGELFFTTEEVRSGGRKF